MKDTDHLSSIFAERLDIERIRDATGLIEQDAIEQAQWDVKKAAELHVAHVDGEISRDTAELNSPWCDLLRADSEIDWKFEAVWQCVQHHLSNTGFYPAGDDTEGKLCTGLACQLSTFWLSTYAEADVVPSEVAQRVQDLYDEKDFWDVYSAWYKLEEASIPRGF